MENNLLAISLRYAQLNSDLKHGVYTGEFSENLVIDVLIDEILSTSDNSDPDMVKNLARNMYFLGSIRKN